MNNISVSLEVFGYFFYAFFFFQQGGKNQREGGRKGGDPTTTAKTNLQWKTNVKFPININESFWS